MARVRLPSFSVVVVVAGGVALVALVVLRVAGIGDGGDAAPAEPELLGEPCVWFDSRPRPRRPPGQCRVRVGGCWPCRWRP